jgi:hypothetical protein
MQYSNTHLNNADLERCLHERLEQEQQRISLQSNQAQHWQMSRDIESEGVVKGMDFFSIAVDNTAGESKKSGYGGNCCASNICGSTDDNDDSVRPMKTRKRRCQFRNRRHIGRHWDPENELNIISLRLFGKTFDEIRRSRNEINDMLNHLSLDFNELTVQANDTVVTMMKDATRSSMSSSTANVSASSHEAMPILYGSAAA